MARVQRLEQRKGEDETDRRLRSLSDEELDEEIARVDAQCRVFLARCGIECVGMPIDQVIVHLTAIEKAEAEKVLQ